jgi:hypothetical protein
MFILRFAYDDLHKGDINSKKDIAGGFHDLMNVVLLIISLDNHYQLKFFILSIDFIVVGRDACAESF